MKFFRYLFKTVFYMIWTLIIVIAISFFTFKQGYSGLWLDNYGTYQVLTIKIKDNVTTKVFGDIPMQNNISINLWHRENSNYNKLTTNEKIVYDTVLNRAIDILENKNTSTDVYIYLEGFEINGYNNELSVEKRKELILNACSEIDYKKVNSALMNDFSYYMWWEFEMSWDLTGPLILFEDNDFGTSYIEIEMSPSGIYKETDSTIKQEYVELANKAYLKAKEVANVSGTDIEKMNIFKEWILYNVNYDDEVAKEISLNNFTEKINSRNFINVFDDDVTTNVVCSGYSSAFQLLCDLANINTVYYQVGSFEVDGDKQNHAWNIYSTGNTKYLIDLTNCQSGTIGWPDELYLVPVSNNEYTIYINQWAQIKYNEELN